MKTYAIAGLCLLAASLLTAQGIEFNHQPWADVLAKARAENKIIFMDAYTSWCGPCKLMSKQTFPDESVGKFYNANFINVKMDMEKGEGVELSTRYNVMLYPTLLFISAAGEVVHRVAGYHDAEQFLALGRQALNPDQTLLSLENRYKNGDRSPSLLRALMDARSAAFDPGAGPLADEFLASQRDWGTPSCMEVIYRYASSPYAEGFGYMIKNRKQFETKFGQKEVAGRIEAVFSDYIQNRPTLTLDSIRQLYTTVYPINGERLASAYTISYYRQRGDGDNFAKAAIDHYARYATNDPDELNEIAWVFYQNIEDKKQLKSALQWAQQSVKIRESYYNVDTLAALYAKLGDKKKARKNAERAIELAKSIGEDYTQTQALLDSL